jgi:hypothetical protein
VSAYAIRDPSISYGCVQILKVQLECGRVVADIERQMLQSVTEMFGQCVHTSSIAALILREGAVITLMTRHCAAGS